MEADKTIEPLIISDDTADFIYRVFRARQVNGFKLDDSGEVIQAIEKMGKVYQENRITAGFDEAEKMAVMDFLKNITGKEKGSEEVKV